MFKESLAVYLEGNLMSLWVARLPECHSLKPLACDFYIYSTFLEDTDLIIKYSRCCQRLMKCDCISLSKPNLSKVEDRSESITIEFLSDLLYIHSHLAGYIRTNRAVDISSSPVNYSGCVGITDSIPLQWTDACLPISKNPTHQHKSCQARDSRNCSTYYFHSNTIIVLPIYLNELSPTN